MKRILYQHVYKSWKTTLIGALILLAAVTSIFLVENINWLDASIGIIIGLALVFSPDSLLKKIHHLLRSPKPDRCD